MRILLLSQFYPPIIGGEERHVRSLAHGLVARGHDVCVATLWRPDAPECDGAVRLRYVKGVAQRLSGLFTDPQRRHAPPFPDPELSLALKRVVDEEQPDVAHAHNWIVHSFLPVKLLTGLPLVLTMHDCGYACPKKNAMRNDLSCDGPRLATCVGCAADHYGYPKGLAVTLGVYAGARLQRRAVDAFIAVSAAVRNFNGFSESDPACVVIPNFIPDDLERIDPCATPSDLLPKGDYILFVGDLNRQKGVHVLVDAYSWLEDAPPLVLVGRRCAETPKPLPRNTIVIESLPHEQVKQAWSRCLFGVVPSTCRDACPTVAMEAMAFGKALIGSDIGGIPSIIAHGDTGLLVPPGHREELASAMSMLIENSALRRRMGAAGVDAVRGLKTSAVIERIEGVYRHVIAKAGAVPAMARATLPQERGR
ncbi:glycosyltransferase family 4 protein [Methylocystis parvus]|uniref:Glycosyltransferase family 4 protein n=1 Tax=Methylocystis parvus TaxID=134 RepID=A0A6B8M8F2_9HYPH|nr:glycosyltransferase family 4 protein [Methylocystis parvus]QGM99051.1 glycosyltransferase family 4 protein [Methylocystis parvus]WBK00582.1 glycosyltransferase family 4 protein [Methylocystis parvus OBBP]